jgi:hypothetical protein
MELEALRRLVPKYSQSNYIMDRCFMWVLMQVRFLIEEIEDYNSIEIQGSPNQLQIRLLLKETKELNISGRIQGIIWELMDEILMIETGVLVDGTSFKVKNKEKSIQFRKELIGGFKTLLVKFKQDLSELDKLKLENARLNERIKELERYR